MQRLERGRGVAAFEREAFVDVAFLETVAVGVDGALGELGCKIGDVAIFVEEWHEGRLDGAGSEVLPPQHCEPGMFLDAWNVLHAFFWTFEQQLS